MAERQNTGNAIPSNDLKDLSDNTQIIDEFVNSEETETTDRLGNTIKTRVGILADLQERVDQIDNTKFVPLDGSKSADKLALTDGDSTLELTASEGELLIGDKQALLATIIDAIKTITADTNFTGLLQKDGSDVTALSDFSISKSSNGYQKLPNGLIMQWMYGTSNSSGGITFTYPVAFPTSLGCFVGMTNDSQGSYVSKVTTGLNTKSQMFLQVWSSYNTKYTSPVEVHGICFGW